MATLVQSPPANTADMNPALLAHQFERKKRISIEEFRARVAQGRTMVVYEGVVYDITNFKHPGGMFLNEFNGMDITHQFRTGHWYNMEVLEVLERYRKGELIGTIMSEADRDLLQISKKLEKEGLFVYEWSHAALDFAEIFGLTLLLVAVSIPAFAYSSRLLFWLGIGVFCLLQTRAFWWMHDTSHHAVFPFHQAFASKVLNVMAFIVGGVSYPTYHHVHHVITNVLDHDSALDTGPIVFHPKMKERAWRWTLAIQRPIWLGIILPIVYFLAFVPQAYEGWFKKKQWFYMSLSLARFAVSIYFLGWEYTFIPPAFSCASFAFIAGLNHFHMPMSDTVEPSFSKAMTKVTQNIDTSYSWTWFSGHLDYHIEHHLFPTMPRYHLPKVKGLVMDFCRRHELQYHTCNLSEVTRRFLFQLGNPMDTSQMDRIESEPPLSKKVD